MTRFDAQRLHTLIENHVRYTGSRRATQIIEKWNDHLPRFVKVMPVDYRRALQQMQARWRATESNGISVAVGY
jgi:glutamate synthase (NADPH/NADH) large chain